MKFDDILAPRISLRVRPKGVLYKLQEGAVRAVKLSTVRGEFDLLCADASVTVVPCERPDVNRLTDALFTGRATLAQLSDIDAAGGAMLTLLLFSGEELTMGEIEIGIDEKLSAALKVSTTDDAAQQMREQSVLMHGDKAYFVLVAGGATKTYLEKEEVADRRFAIIGANIRYALTERDKGNGETVFLASGITKRRNQQADAALRLACGELKFVDWTRAGQRSILAKAQFEATMRDGDSYLRKWDEFAGVEGELFLERARAVGKVSFQVLDDSRDGGGTVRVQCQNLSSEQKKALQSGTELDVVDDEGLPPYLNDLQMTFEDFSKAVVEKLKEEEKEDRQDRKEKERSQPLTVIGFSGVTELDLQAQSVPKRKWLIYSVAGETAQMRRRADAREAIANGRSANPELGLIIQGGGTLPPSQPPPKMKAMSHFVERKLFQKYKPTQKQLEAISIALNTPDIALIQGPPGTGKTKIIAAILERLNEECDKREGIAGRVLLSGFQHDAVENMIEDLKINGIPVLKSGQRSGEEQNANLLRFERDLWEWCREHASALREKNPQIVESLEERNIRLQCIQYIKAPSLSLALALLDSTLKLPESVLGEELGKALRLERNRLAAEHGSAHGENPKLAVVRGLRVTEAGFGDDGPDRASDALCQLENDLSDWERDMLGRAIGWSSRKGAPDFLGDLRKLKGELLLRYAPMPTFRTEKARDSVVKLIEEVLSRIRISGLSARDKRISALTEMLQEMENNPAGAVDAVRDYSFAFAATCQQSVNGMMRQLKGVMPDSPNDKKHYDFVIVDEAARASPRDLMIPMCQGKRIILVGDHRQLPQLIDEEVARRMETGTVSASEEKDWLQKSMFEYLIKERIPKLEEADGVLRHVMLDQQHRMPPDLGNFISENFYERFGDEQVKSDEDHGQFAYDLPGTDGRCAIWLNVPRKKGGMSPSGTSWTRPAEVSAICEKLKAWVEYDREAKLSFGVIAFYKAQTEAISRMLGEKWLDSVGEDRLRIGTVDSFQGRQFDVVFLSLVRTETKGFGFLKSNNRLNVSMSRQKKLLVAVGDAAFYDTDAAREQVPGLANFLKLCNEKGPML